MISIDHLKQFLPALRRLALPAILILAAILRLTHVASNPGWYTDEATHLDIAAHLLDGQIRYLAVNRSTLLFSRLPLFDLLLAGLLPVSADGMLILRTFTGSLGVIGVGLVYVVVGRLQTDRLLPLLAALLFAIYPDAVIYSRFGFSYNLLVPLALLIIWGLGEYHRSGGRGWLVLAALAGGLGMISDLFATSFVLPVLVVVSLRDRRALLWSVPLLLIFPALYAILYLIIDPAAFLFDLHFILARLNSAPFFAGLGALALNYTILLDGLWMGGGLVGLFMLPDKRLRGLALLFLFVPIILIGRAAALHSLGFYYLIPLLPLAATGLAALIRYGGSQVVRVVEEGIAALLPAWGMERLPVRRFAVLLAIILIGTPFMVSTRHLLAGIQSGLQTQIDPFLINPADACAAADYVNARLEPDDLVIASPGVAWLVEGNAADFQMALAATGQATPHLPADLPPDRLVFDPRFDAARFVIVDNLWRRWAAADVPGVDQMLVRLDEWEVVFRSGEIVVYTPD